MQSSAFLVQDKPESFERGFCLCHRTMLPVCLERIDRIFRLLSLEHSMSRLSINVQREIYTVKIGILTECVLNEMIENSLR